MELVSRLATVYSAKFGRTLNPLTEITVSVGATEALFALMQSLLNPGDEVVIMEPAFDIYAAQVVCAGGVCKFVPLRVRDNATTGAKEWYLDMKEFAAAFTPKTKAFLLNTPQNPTGKVFTVDELLEIAAIIKAQPHHVTVLADEVYENIVFPPAVHTHFATLPGMWEHTATVSSAGKTFSVTGWKCGWVIGPADIVNGVMVANQWVQFSVATPVQRAVGLCFDRAFEPYEGKATYFDWLRDMYIEKKGKLMSALTAAGLKPIAPEGSFFIMADTSDIDVPAEYLSQSTPACPVMTRDWAFCRWLAHEHGVVAIPPSAFYCDEDKPLCANYARFAFCKTEASLEMAKTRLEAMGAAEAKKRSAL